MSIIWLPVALILTLVSGRDVVGPLPFAVPLLRVSGLLQPAPTSSTRVALEVGPQGTIALLYEVPLGSAARALRLPDGRQLAITP